MMSYDTFLELMERTNLDPKNYLPEIFGEIIDEFDYTSDDVSTYSNKSDVTVRRWFRNGEIKVQSIRPYICKGIDIKRKLFKDIYRQNIAPKVKNLIRDELK